MRRRRRLSFLKGRNIELGAGVRCHGEVGIEELSTVPFSEDRCRDDN